MKCTNGILSDLDLFQVATENGAKALGISEKVGSLKVGLQADLAAIKIDIFPVYHPLNSLIHTGKHTVDYVFVKGKMLLRNGKTTTLNEERIKKDAGIFAEKFREWNNSRKSAQQDYQNIIQFLEKVEKASELSEVEKSQKQMHLTAVNMFIFFANRYQDEETSLSHVKISLKELSDVKERLIKLP